MSDPQTPATFGCPLCFGDDAEAARRHKLEMSNELIDESHFGVSLRRCPTCGQMFVSIFTEFVDWTDGDDPQYWDVLPLTAAEADELAAQADNVDLKRIETFGSERRRLKVDYPKGGPKRISWAIGGLSIMPRH